MFFIQSCRAWESHRVFRSLVKVGDPFFATQTRSGNRTRVFGKGFDFVIEDKISNLQNHIQHSHFKSVSFKNRKDFNRFLAEYDVVEFTDNYDPMKSDLGYHQLRNILFDRKSNLELAIPYLLDLDNPDSFLNLRLKADEEEIRVFYINLKKELEEFISEYSSINYSSYLNYLKVLGRIKLLSLTLEKLRK